MASDPLSRNYAVLTAPERFALMVEAMARKDEAEADRLEDSCPQMVYRQDDTGFRDRMQRAYLITLMVCLNMRQGLGQIRAAVTFSKVYKTFAAGPAQAMQGALLFGREYAKWEAGGEAGRIPSGAALDAELKRCPDLGTQLAELRDIAGEAMEHVSKTLTYVIGVANATDLLSQWEGFGRFCRQELGLEPLTLTAAFELGREDPAAEVLVSYPDAKADEERAAKWQGTWTRNWEWRFAGSG